jgi:ligand-binding sensor domain-containing protein
MLRGCLAGGALLLLAEAVVALPALAPSPAEVTPVRAFRDFDRKGWPSLPASTTMDLLQDEHGVLWIATLDGLAHFDGHRLSSLEKVPGAPAYGTTSALEPRPGGGFYVAGPAAISIYDHASWRSVPAPGGADSLAAFADGLARVDRGGSLSLLRAEKEPWQELPLPESTGRAVALDVAAGGPLFLATTQAIHRWDGTAWRQQGDAIAAGAITSLLVARDGTRWVGTDQGRLFALAPGAGAWRAADLPPWKSGRIRALIEDRRGRIWAGGLHGGLAFGYPNGPFELWTAANGLHGDGVVALLADREGTLWISFNGRGLQQWLGEEWTHRTSWQGSEGVQRLPVFGITPSRDGGFFAAVYNRGLWHWDGAKLREFGAAEGLTENMRFAYEPEPGVLWVAGRYGIWERRGGRPFVRVLDLPAGFAYAILPAPDGSLHAITSAAGIYRFHEGRWQAEEAWNARLPATNVRALLWRDGLSSGPNQQAQTLAVVGTVAGVGFYDPQGEAVPPPYADWQVVPEAVNALLDGGDGLWVGGHGGLAFCADADRKCRAMPLEELPGRTIYALARATDGAIWAGGASGVGRYADGLWSRYDAGNGLIEDECNHYGLLARPGGEMLVGTMASLARFDPVVQPLKQPPLALQWRPPADPAAVARLPPRSLQLDWHAPWLLPQRLEYQLRVPRLSPDWLPAQTEDSRLFESLGPGIWDFEIAARRDGRGPWSAPLLRRVEVAPRFTETWGFDVLLALAGLALVGLVVGWRTRRLKRQAGELQRAVDDYVARLKVLRGLLPICASCKKVRNDGGYWQQIETYVREHSEAEFSHGYCPDCFDRLASALDAHFRHGRAPETGSSPAPPSPPI